MDKVVEAVEKTKKDWAETYGQTLDRIKSIEQYGKPGSASREAERKDSLPRLNGVAQDGLAALTSLHFDLDVLAPHSSLPMTRFRPLFRCSNLGKIKPKVEGTQITDVGFSLRLSLRNANLQAKANMRKTAQEERELLLGGGEESTARRCNLQTKAGMTSAAESITDSLRRTRQLMVQATYLQHLPPDYLYDCALMLPVPLLDSPCWAAIKAGMAGQAELGPLVDGLNFAQARQNAVPEVEVALEQPMHDEL
ncbi:hypothetical protein RJ639_004957 [Escallonia herrerae]|uniref:Uncharacterized protein n=1 Tax=Escallonia herrerae TaxID=1293975 RepID=A0AA88W479_9ASTE|nr:hypothetical protein RJ639_004957 [Escallonia herrerae]